MADGIIPGLLSWIDQQKQNAKSAGGLLVNSPKEFLTNTQELTPVSDLWERAQTQYPYLKDKNISYINTPNEKDNRYLEFWPPNEPGAPEMPRPKELPINSVGIQVIKQKTTPTDILADYVSHYGVNNDKELNKLYKDFEKVTPKKDMEERYKYHVKNYGEDRPYEQWYKSTGLPEIFRGYTFNQWGENSANYYSPEQLKVLDKVRKKLGVN
jgi:hypothetical protein